MSHFTGIPIDRKTAIDAKNQADATFILKWLQQQTLRTGQNCTLCQIDGGLSLFTPEKSQELGLVPWCPHEPL